MTRLAALASCLALIAACGSEPPASTPTNRCIPGMVIACPCPGGGSGVQRCLPDGTYATCECREPPRDAEAPPDVPHDASLADLTSMDGPADGAITDGSTIDVPSGDDAAVDVARPDDVAVRAYPPGPYGTGVGATLQPLTLSSCFNPDGEWRFDRNGWETSPLTVISIVSAWCVPCQMEARLLRAEITFRYAGRNLRFVQILTQDRLHAPITHASCLDWVMFNGLTGPELMDPTETTGALDADGMYPAAVVVDASAHIRWRAVGDIADLAHLRAAIDDALAHP